MFEPGGRFEAMVEGLTDEQRRGRIAEIAWGLNHWAIPQEEKMHLLVTSHHGLRQGAKKEKGEKEKEKARGREGHVRLEAENARRHEKGDTASFFSELTPDGWPRVS